MKVFFPQYGIELDMEPGLALADIMRDAGIEVSLECGGRGGCGKCRVRFISNAPPPRRADRHHIEDDDLEKGIRLACAAIVDEDTEIEFLTTSIESRPVEFNQCYERDVAENASPAMKIIDVEMQVPSITDQRSDLRRLSDILPNDLELNVPVTVLRDLPTILRDAEFKISGIVDRNKLVDLTATGKRRLLAVALDIGTTTICARLLDVKTGTELASAVVANPQRLYGADVASRISFIMSTTRGLARMRELVVRRINDIIRYVAGRAKVEIKEIYNVTAVGNPSMIHIFLGIDPCAIAPAPYISPTTSMLEYRACDASIEVAGGATLRVLPAASAYIGADAVSAALRAGLMKSEKPALVIDLGTNAEIILTDGNSLYACSAAAGPALEGAHTKFGMTAARGAISVVNIADEIEFETIGGSEPKGICGTGLLDAICGMISNGVIESNGRIAPVETENLPGKIVDTEEGREFILTDTAASRITISQKDVRQYQLARGAIRGGIEVLLEKAGLATRDLDKIYLAGALGTAIRTESALGAGIVPKVEPSVIQSIGNAALDGAADSILDEAMIEGAERFARQVKYIELSSEPSFTDLFVGYMSFDS